MKNLSVPRWMLLGNNGAGWLPNVSLIADDLTGGNRRRVINNEAIHQPQQDEAGYVAWVLMYLDFLLEYGYQNNPFEVDSRTWDSALDSRPSRFWESILGDVK